MVKLNERKEIERGGRSKYGDKKSVSARQIFNK